MHLRSPSGLDFGALLPRAPYADLSACVVVTWRLAHWFSWMFAATRAPNATALEFTAGGHQGGEGADAAAEWFVQGVEEELDADNEFLARADGTLLLIVNASDAEPGGAPPPDVDAPALAVYFNVSGARGAPVANVSFAGLVFVDGAPTFMDARGVPSGGDWALERAGALLFEGTEGASVSDCAFSRIDGNAVFFSGYNRGARVERSTFELLGQTAVALWGRADGVDGTAMDVPRGTLVAGCLAHDVGLIQKQSAFFFTAVAAETTLDSNIVYNVPRAAINIDDGFGGGNVVRDSVLFNTCRESSDHGPINSWDRLPYITTVRDGVTPSAVPADNIIGPRNLIVSNYGADGGMVDNDDGSAYYVMRGNVGFFGGHKSDFDGHSKRSLGNLYVSPAVYGGTCVFIASQQLPPPGFAEVFANNTCVLDREGEDVLALKDYIRVAADPAASAKQLLLANNSIFVPGGVAGIAAKSTGFTTYAQWQAAGYDNSTVVSGDVPPPERVAAWARAMLGM